MTDEAFTQGILAMRETLYRISYGLLRREEDRLDAVQEALAKAWAKRATLKEASFLKTWVVRILINECHNIGRRQQHITLVEAVPEMPAPAGADPALHDALLTLPQKLRLPVMLHYMEGYTARETAEILHIPPGTVATRLRKARECMREELSEEVTCRA